ncbi:hypothetical protein B2J93_8875 [Marssonina coronariae]|uniref:Uncharacterized protein n=1 Tax=Diplocarpon coronariae TaxID=2795749 RepID=A0A218YTA0_9HELO|nr:hypothetical protein B2J93_8875 [Marssonina coronariae]
MGTTARDLLREALDHNDAQSRLAPCAVVIGTKGRLNLMDLPTELRVKIYEDLLILPHELHIPSEVRASNVPIRSNDFAYPANAILQTCKLVNQEATPIFYGKNTFKICLVAVLKGTAFLYSPVCPDNNMALSISSWVSTKVLYLELDAIQKEMEAIMATS